MESQTHLSTLENCDAVHIWHAWQEVHADVRDAFAPNKAELQQICESNQLLEAIVCEEVAVNQGHCLEADHASNNIQTLQMSAGLYFQKPPDWCW